MLSLYRNRTLWVLVNLLYFSIPSFAQVCNTCDPSFTINNGLIACYPFNGNANDASGNSRDGTPTSLTYTADRFGNANRAVIANGTGANAEISYTAFQVPEFTYSVWVNITTMPTTGTYYSALSIGNGTVDQAILLANNPSIGHLGFGLASYNTDATPIPGPNQTGILPAANRWYHVVMVRSTSLVSLYVDGIFISSTGTSGKTPGYSVGGGYAGYIGKRTGSITQNFNGKIDDVRIFNRPLTATEVARLYHSDFNDTKINASSDKSICLGDSVLLAVNGSIASLSWTPSGSLSSSVSDSTYAKPTTTTQYIVTSTAAGLCSITDTVIVNVNSSCCTNCTLPIPLNTGLVTCYPLDGNANDMVSAANNGIATATVNTTNRFGRPNAAMLFNGTSSKIVLPGTNLQLNNYTYSAWVKVTANPTTGNAGLILSIGNGVGPLGDQNLLLTNAYSTPSQTGFEVMGYTNPSIFPLPPDFALTGTLPTPGIWYHIVGVRSTYLGKMRLYVNGVQVNETALSTLTAGYATPVMGVIGARVNGTSQFFNGAIDDVRIYDRVLSNSEIIALYNQTDITPAAASGGTDKNICAGDSVQLNASGGVSYSWSPTIGLSNPSLANPFAKPSTTTQYIVTVNNGTCITTDTVIVTVNTNCCATCATVDPINTGLLACYPLNGSLNDNSGNARHGTPTSVTYTTDRFSTASHSGLFNGASNSSSNITYTAFQASQYTYSVWVNVASMPTSGNYYSAISIGNNSVDQAILLGNNSTLGHVGFGVAVYNSDLSLVTGLTYTGSLPTTNRWYHLVLVRSSSQVNFYVDGVLVSSASTAGKVPGYGTTAYGAFIGKRIGATTQNFTGKIDDVRIYDRALSSAEISQLYTLVPSPIVTPISDKTICLGDSVQLVASGGTSYAWSPSTGLSSTTVPNPYAKPSINQEYIVNVTIGNCSIRDTLNVNIQPATLVVSNDSTVCKGDSIQLSASGTATYRWSTQTTLSDSTIANPYAKPTVTTKYYVTGTSGLCSNRDSVTIMVNLANFDAGSDSLVCIGDSIQLLATGASAYKWQSLTTLSDSTIANPFAKPTVTQKYFVSGTQGLCTAIDSVNIIVNTINLDAGIGDTICPGDSIQLIATGATTYTWHTKATLSDSTIANPYAKPTTTTTYYVTGKSGTCTSLDSVTIVVHIFNPDAGTNQFICASDSVMLQASGGNTYNWRYNLTLTDSTIASPYSKPVSTTKYYVVIDDGTCSATDSVTVTILTSLNVNAGSDTLICLGDSIQLTATGATTYKWYYNVTLSDSTIANPFVKPTTGTKYYVVGNTGSCSATDSVQVNISTITADAGTNHSICGGDSVQLIASGGTSYKWRYNTTLSDSTIANPFARPAVTSMYYVTVKNGPCTATDSANVSIVGTVTIDAGTNKNICLGDSVQLTATGATAFKWRYNLSLSDSTIFNPFAKPASLTKYFVTGTTGICSATDSVEVSISTITVDAGTNQSICGGDSIQLVASGGTSYNWSYNTSLSDSTIGNPYAKPSVSTQYIVTAINGVCIASDSVTINILTTVNVDAGSDQQLCSGDSVQLQANGATNYSWLPLSGLSDATVSNPKASPLLSTDYIVMGEILTCRDYDTVRVTVNPIPAVDLGPDATKCLGEIYGFNPTIAGGDTYLWSPASLLSDATIQNPTTNTSSAQLFTLSVSNSLTGCANSDSVTINISDPKALFTLSDSVSISPPLVVNFTNNSIPTPLLYNWVINDSIPSYYTSTNPSHTFLFVGRYPVTLTVTDPFGCVDTFTRFVTINDNVGVYIPNVFTPNNDGLNEVFRIKYDVGNTVILTGTIWNRWGGKIYDFTMPNGKWWDGKANGIDVSPDTYYYIVTIVDKKNEATQYHGTITVLR